jgi:hypothetical protein
LPFGAFLIIGEPSNHKNAGNGRAFSILTGRAGGSLLI